MFEFLCSSGDNTEKSSYCSRSSCTLDSNEGNTEPTADSVLLEAG